MKDFLKKIKIFGLRFVSLEDYADYQQSLEKRAADMQKIHELERHRDILLEDVDKLEAQVMDLVPDTELIDISMGDPSPVDTETRKLYVAQVAGLHKDILKPKLKHMIANSHKILEEATNDREFDLEMKGAIYAFREFMRWGDAMTNEQLSFQTEPKSEGVTN